MSNQNNIGINVKTTIDSAKSKLKDYTDSWKTLGQTTDKTNNSFGQFIQTQKKLNGSFQNMSKDINRSTTSISSMGKGLFSLGGIIKGIGLGILGRNIADAIQSNVEMIETIHLFEVAMGDFTEATDTALVSMSKFMGLDNTNLQNRVATYNLLARSMGMTSKNASVLSVNANKLATDLASLTNTSITQVSQDIRSGLIGQSRTMYKYGVDVTESAIKVEALNQGITKSVRLMTQGEKMALRYAVMIKQTSLSHGDFAKTINTPANQMKILSERFVTLTRAIGSVFIPMLSAVLPWINAVVSVLTRLISLFAIFVGYKPPDKPKDGMGGLIGVADDAEDAEEKVGGVTKALKKMKKALGGFDEINVLGSPDTPDSGKGGKKGEGSGSPFDMDLMGYDNLMESVKQQSDELVAKIEGVLGKFKELSKPLADANFEPLINSLNRLWDAVKVFGGIIGQGLEYFYTKVLVPLGVWAIETFAPKVFETLATALETLNRILVVLTPLGKWFVESVLTPMGKFTGELIIKGLDKINKELVKFGDWVEKNPKKFETMIIILGSFAIAIGLVVGAFALWKGINAIVLAVTGIISSGFLIPIAVIGSVIAYGVLLMRNWDDIKAEATIIKELVSKEWEIITTNLSREMNLIKKTVSEGWENMWKAVDKWITNIRKSVNTWGAEQDKKIKDTVEAIKKWWSDGWENMNKVVGEKIELIRKAVVDWADGIDTKIKTFMEGIKKVWSDKWEEMKTSVTTILGNTKEAMSKKWDEIKFNMDEKVKGMINATVNFFSELPNKIKEKLDLFKNTIGTWVSNSTTWFGAEIPKLLNSIVDWFAKLPNSMVDIGSNMIKGLWNGVLSVGDWLMNKMKGYFGKLWDVASDLFGKVGSGVKATFAKPPRFARGGSISSGQLFEAGEFGKAELVGNYNGQTTVMPLENSGFISAMENAVIRGVTNAMKSGGGDSGTPIIVNVGGKTLVDTVVGGINRQSRVNGKTIITI